MSDQNPIQTMGLSWRRRQFSIKERAFFEMWIKHNERVNYINSGGSILDWIMVEDAQEERLTRIHTPPRVSERDEAVAMELMQWLGTNGGQAYLLDVRRKIEDEKERTIEGLLDKKEQQRIKESLPDDIRARGWAVAVHNDYRLDGVPHTFWLFTKGDKAVKGEGATDAEALNQARAAIAKIEGERNGR